MRESTPSAMRIPEAVSRKRELDRVDVLHVERAERDEGQTEAGGGEADRLNRQLALAAPVDILQMQDQGELVQDERRAGTDRHAANERQPSESGPPTAVKAPMMSRMRPGTE